MRHAMSLSTTSTLKRFTGGLMIAAIAIVSGQAANAEEPTLFKIEEDWELVVNDPDANTNSPQITFFTCPNSGDETTYFQLQMNYFADEAYSSGGFHVAAVRDETTLDQARSQTRRLITVDGDKIVWTSVMACIDGELLFAVKDGFGDDWGAFGGPDYLVRMSANGTQDLSSYSPTQSGSLVDIGYGANRVHSVVLKQVRFFYTDGSVTTTATNLSL